VNPVRTPRLGFPPSPPGVHQRLLRRPWRPDPKESLRSLEFAAHRTSVHRGWPFAALGEPPPLILARGRSRRWPTRRSSRSHTERSPGPAPYGPLTVDSPSGAILRHALVAVLNLLPDAASGGKSGKLLRNGPPGIKNNTHEAAVNAPRGAHPRQLDSWGPGRRTPPSNAPRAAYSSGSPSEARFRTVGPPAPCQGVTGGLNQSGPPLGSRAGPSGSGCGSSVRSSSPWVRLGGVIRPPDPQAPSRSDQPTTSAGDHLAVRSTRFQLVHPTPGMILRQVFPWLLLVDPALRTRLRREFPASAVPATQPGFRDDGPGPAQTLRRVAEASALHVDQLASLQPRVLHDDALALPCQIPETLPGARGAGGPSRPAATGVRIGGRRNRGRRWRRPPQTRSILRAPDPENSTSRLSREVPEETFASVSPCAARRSWHRGFLEPRRLAVESEGRPLLEPCLGLWSGRPNAVIRRSLTR